MLPCQYNFASSENNDGEDHDIMILAGRKSDQQKIPGKIITQKIGSMANLNIVVWRLLIVYSHAFFI